MCVTWSETEEVKLEEKEFFKTLFAKINVEEDTGGEGGAAPALPPKPRPQISLKIPQHPPYPQDSTTSPPRPVSFYYEPRTMVAIPVTPGGPHTAGDVALPLGFVQAYPNKASEFMFKQFEGESLLLQTSTVYADCVLGIPQLAAITYCTGTYMTCVQ